MPGRTTTPPPASDPAAGQAPAAGPVLAAELIAISKAFYRVAANHEVDLDVRRGEIHAVLGENGAGKSTLCSILAGHYRPDAGAILVDGEERRFRTQRDALAVGVGMVFQHFRLVERFTVAENLALGAPDVPVRTPRAELERRARAASERFGIDVRPAAYIEDLSVGEQQRVEILKLLARGVRLLILDEPTAVLTPQESETLFVAMREFVRGGGSIVFVSHKLDEVLRHCDRITVLRDGHRITTIDAADAEPRLLARLMVERDGGTAAAAPSMEPATTRPVAASADGASVLAVRGLEVMGDHGAPAIRALDLDVAAGSIVGVAGVAGNGQRELAEALAGMRRATAGSIQLAGRDITGASVRARTRAGIGYVPENRLTTGVAGGLGVPENLVLRSYWRWPFSRRGLLRRRAIRREAARQVERLDVRGVRDDLPVRVLSGGNLQRVILARETASDPTLLVVASPTRGLDVAATESVRGLLREQRDRGVAILLLSEDLDELLELADRIVVLYEGRLVGETAAADRDVERLGLLMAGRTEASP